jgi:RND superfamily putative drug exporter
MPTPPPPAANAPAATPSRAPGAPPRWLRAAIPAVLVLAWLVAAAIGGPYFGRVDEVSSNEQSSYLPSSADAT